jgi:hypothetical protein
MPDGIFDLTTAEHMLAKLRLEVEAFKADETARHAVNAMWTGYHLIEWSWNDRLRNDAHLQERVGARNENELRAKVRTEHPQIEVVRALANGSKHFERRPNDPITGVHRGGFSSTAFSKGAFNVDHLFIELDGRRHDVEHILDALLEYWDTFFSTHLR